MLDTDRRLAELMLLDCVLVDPRCIDVIFGGPNDLSFGDPIIAAAMRVARELYGKEGDVDVARLGRIMMAEGHKFSDIADMIDGSLTATGPFLDLDVRSIIALVRGMKAVRGDD